MEQPLLAGGSGSQLVQPDAPSWADRRVISHITTPIGSSSLIYLIGISLLQPVTVAFCVWVAGLWAEPACIFCKRPIHPADNSAEIPSWSTSLPLLAHHVQQPFTALMVTLNMNHKKQTTTTTKSKQINKKNPPQPPTARQRGLLFLSPSGKRHYITRVITEKFLRKWDWLSLHTVSIHCFPPTGMNCSPLAVTGLASTSGRLQ